MQSCVSKHEVVFQNMKSCFKTQSRVLKHDFVSFVLFYFCLSAAVSTISFGQNITLYSSDLRYLSLVSENIEIISKGHGSFFPYLNYIDYGAGSKVATRLMSSLFIHPTICL